MRFDIPENGDMDGDFPCFNRPEEHIFSGSGQAWGIARNYLISETYDYLYVSITGQDDRDDCHTSADDYWCFGAARIDLSTGSPGTPSTFTRSWNTNNSCNDEEEGPCQAVDVLGQEDGSFSDIVIAEKQVDRVAQHDIFDDTVDIVHGGATEATQLDWLNGLYYVATIAGSEETSACPSTAPSWNGELWLLGLDDGSVLDFTAVGGVNSGSKPEGVVGMRVKGDNNSCHPDADYVVYVSDWCESLLYVYSVNLATESIVRQEAVISLDTDIYGNTSSLSGGCYPSAVAPVRDGSTWDVYVLCQTRDSIIRIHTTSNQCNPYWDRDEDEVRLQRYASGDSSDLCNTTSTTMTPCSGGGQCSPHDLGFDMNVWPDWVFVALTKQNQVIAIERSDMSNQHLMYLGDQYFEPQEIDIAPSCDPSDPNCQYPH